MWHRMNWAYIAPEFRIELIGYFSIDSDLHYHEDLSQLKYYIPPSDPNNVNFDLNINLKPSNHRSSSTSHIKLDNVLRWLSEHFKKVERPLLIQKERWLEPNFVSSRGTIRTILCSLHIKSDWIIYAAKYRGTIYFYEPSDEKESDQAGVAMPEKQTSGFYKFKQYLIADNPSDQPNPSVSRNENEEFHCVFRAYFGHHTLLYSAKVDCISSEQPITDTLIDKPSKWVGLKVFRTRSGILHTTPSIISKCWSANYLIGAEKIVIGFKHPNNIVKSIKEYSANSLLKTSKPYCDVNKSKLFFNKFLDDVNSIVTKDHDKCIYRLHWKSASKIISYLEKPNDENYLLIKPWFIKAEEYRRTQQTSV